MVHSDPDGIVLPGETVSVRASVTWSSAIQFAGLHGDARATNDLGVASSIGSALGGPLPPLWVFGVPAGGSVVGFDVATTPAFFQGSPSWYLFQNTGFDVLKFDWTAPTVAVPTVVRFDFVAASIAPNVRLYPSTNSPAFVDAQTTYIGTSILVLPAPGGVLVLAAAGLASARRRRAHG